MSNYKRFFQKQHTLLPVIHVITKEQALYNANIALGAGCDGVFLINHHICYKELLNISLHVRDKYPEWWIGVNLLDVYPADIFSLVDNSINGIWVDNAMIDENLAVQNEAEDICFKRSCSGWNGIYFGGVAFKYQRPVLDLEKASKIAMNHVDVITTSGIGTGISADIDKIKTIKTAIGDFPLAVASGITPDNVENYLTYVDCFLVATGISKTFTELDPVLVDKLVKNINR